MSSHKKNICEIEELRRRLKETESLCQTFVQSNLYGIQEMDIYGNIIHTNSVLCEMLGYSGGELRGKQIWQLLASDSDREKLTEYLTKLTHGEDVPHLWVGRYVKKKRKKKNREIIELQQNWRYRQDEEKRITGFVSLTTDIINYKQAQRGGPQGEEERYRLIVDAVRDMVMTFDMHGIITYVNEIATEVLGYFEEEFLAMSIDDILPSEHLEKIKEELMTRYAVGDRRAVSSKAEFANRNLKTLPVEISASLIIKKESGASGILLIAHESDERATKKNEEFVRSNTEDSCRLIIENLGEMILTFDMEGRITYMNQVGEDLTGYFKDELPDMDIGDLFPPEHLESLKKRLLEDPVNENRHITIPDAEFINRELRLIPVEINSSVIMKQGRPSDILIAARDLSLQRRMEKELVKMEKFESLATLANGFADELNNHLTGIMGNIELAQMGMEPGGKPHKILSYAKKSCVNIKDLARQFIVFSKGGTIIRKIGSLAKLIKDSATGALADANVKCDFFISDDLWPVAYDEKQMNMGIRNLIINAREAMPSGGRIKVYMENVSVSEENEHTVFPVKKGNYVKISVQDQGIGIREECFGKIFDPYFSTKNTREVKGRGLGLTISYSVIRKHCGYILMDSKPGTRTTFDIYIPACIKGTPEKKKAKGKKKTKEKPDPIKGRILIMDDEEVVTNVASQMLNKLGYDVTVSKNGDEAIKVYKNAMKSHEPFDAVFLDLHVKNGMGGKETIKKLLKIDPYARGIASSGYSNDREMTDYEKYGFSGAVEKPYSMDELSFTLDEMMEQYETIEVVKAEWINEME